MIVKLPTLGLVCPFPLVEAKEAMAKLNKGDGLEIEFDCTQATEAIPAWAAEEGYEVTNFEQIDDAKWSISDRTFAIKFGNLFCLFRQIKTNFPKTHIKYFHLWIK